MSVSDFEILRFEEIDSTNSALVERARRGAPDGLVLLAGHQTAGRGRLGRTWEAPPGASLLTSILFRVPIGPEQLYLVTAAVSLSALKAIRSLTGIDATLKWPNDVLLGERKVAGVLSELVETGQSTDGPESAIVVGIGINLLWPGPQGVEGTSLLESTGKSIDAESMLAALLAELTVRREALLEPAGRDQIAKEFAQHLGTIGSKVKIELPGEVVVARAIGVSPEGHLIVDDGAGPQEIVTGDVIHLRPHSEPPTEAD
jgi:BirA family biotin operon repressor/biotin-[acetyl-CoA-carboxylase] ligase